MNYVFDSNKNMNEYSELIESEYKLEYLHIGDEILEPQSNVANQFNDFKSPSLDLPSVYDEQMLDSKNVASKNLEVDMLSPYNLISTSLINDSSPNIVELSKADSLNKLDLSEADRTIENAKEKYSEKFDLDNKGLEKLVKVQEPECNSETLCLQKSNTDTLPEQNLHRMIGNITTNQEVKSSGFRRWGRNEDIQIFKTLRELCNQEGISIETFLSSDTDLKDKHHSILLDLVEKHNWKRNTLTMLNRIRLLGKNQAMSVREIKSFHRLCKKAKKENKALNLEEIAHLFPGKLISTLKLYIKQ